MAELSAREVWRDLRIAIPVPASASGTGRLDRARLRTPARVESSNPQVRGRQAARKPRSTDLTSRVTAVVEEGPVQPGRWPCGSARRALAAGERPTARGTSRGLLSCATPGAPSASMRGRIQSASVVKILVSPTWTCRRTRCAKPRPRLRKRADLSQREVIGLVGRPTFDGCFIGETAERLGPPPRQMLGRRPLRLRRNSWPSDTSMASVR